MEIRKSLASVLAMAAACGLTMTGAAYAASTVNLTYSIDGVEQMESFSDDDGDGFISGSFMFMNGNDLISGQFFTVDDPIINIAVSSIDAGAASDFSVSATLITDIPAATYGFDLTGSGGYTDGTPFNGVGIDPLAGNDGIFIGYKDDQVVAVAGGSQFTPNNTGKPLSDVYGPVTDTGSTLVCAAGCSSETLTIAWSGTGQGDSYGLTGQFTNKPSPVPVPAALPLMISAIAAVGVVGLRRKA